MGQYSISDKAAADMAEIYDGMIERGRSEVNADHFFDGLLKTFQNLADFPDMGNSRPYLTEKVQAFPHKEDYIIFYQKTSRGIIILHLLYGGQDLIDYFDKLSKN